MFENCYGYWKLSKKVTALLTEILKTAPDNLCFVRIVADGVNKKIVVTNNTEILRMDIDDAEQSPNEGLYVMAGSLFVPVHNTLLLKGYPDVDPSMDYGNFSKTAQISVPDDNPMVAMSYLIQDFGATLPLDSLCGQFKRLFSFKPGYIRAYGQSDREIAKKSPVKIEMLVDEDGKTFTAPVVFEYMVMPLDVKKEDFVKVDDQPMLFNVKKAG